MNPSTRRDIILLSVNAVLLRLLFHLTYTPWWAGDSPGYSAVWTFFRYRTWHIYDGGRPPVYPVLLGFAQLISGSFYPLHRLASAPAEVVVLLQQIAGVSATIMLYLALRNLDVHRRTAFWGALFFALLAGAGKSEMIILPLALTAYLLIAALWLFTSSARRAANGQSSWRFSVGSGLAFSLAALTRAEIALFLMVFLLIAGGACIIYRRRADFTALRSALLTTTASALPLIIVWMSFNAFNLGQFTLTTYTGINATSSVYNLFDRVEPRDRVFGQIMVAHYRGPVRRDLVNDAWVEMIARRDEMPIERRRPWSVNSDWSRYAGQVSQRLQWRYPRVWLTNAAQSFGRTFDFDIATVPLHHVSDPESPDGDTVVKSEWGYNLTEWLWRVQTHILRAFYCLTLLFVPVALIANKTGRNCVAVKDVIVSAIALSTVATLAAFGFVSTYFPRYGVCYYGCFVLCAVVGCDAIKNWLRLKVSAAQ